MDRATPKAIANIKEIKYSDESYTDKKGDLDDDLDVKPITAKIGKLSDEIDQLNLICKNLQDRLTPVMCLPSVEKEKSVIPVEGGNQSSLLVQDLNTLIAKVYLAAGRVNDISNRLEI